MIKLHTTGVALKMPTAEDKDKIFHWMQNPHLRKMIGTRACPTEAGHSVWFQRKCEDTSNEFLMLTYEGESVGIIGTNVIDTYHRNAEIYLYIGDDTHRGKGIGSAGIQLLLQYLQEKHGIHKVYARIFSFNMPSVRLFESVGFTREGVQKEHVWTEEGFYDLLLYGYIMPKAEQ